MRQSLKAALLGGAFALLLCVTTAQAQPNLLTNGTLDTTAVSTQVLATPTDWTVVSFRSISGPFTDGASSEPWCNVAAAGGFGLFFKPFTGNVTDGDVTTILTQTVPGTPGQIYYFRGWAGAEPGYVGLSDPTVGSLFTMEFLDAGSSPISTSTLDLRAAGLGTIPNPNFGNFRYDLYGLSAVAPAGTASIRVSAQMVDAYGGTGAQAFVVDNFSLAVPEPASLGLLSLGALALLRRRSA